MDDPQWKTKFEDVYADPALQLPIYPILGNHDHKGNPQAQVEYSQRNKNWRMPAQYYTFTHTLEMFKPIDGVYHVVSGAGGGPDMAYGVAWSDASYYAATLGGFTLFRVGKNEIVVEFVRLDGKTQYAHTITK